MQALDLLAYNMHGRVTATFLFRAKPDFFMALRAYPAKNSVLKWISM